MKGLALDGLFVAGVAAVLAGLSQVYPPLAWIAGGTAAIAVAVVIQRKQPR